MGLVIDANGVKTLEDSVELTRVKDIFTGLDEVKKFVENCVVSSERQAEFDRSIAHMPQYMQEVFRHRLIKETGNQKFAYGSYREAISDYIRASVFLLRYKGKVSLPSFDDVDYGLYDKICGGPGYAELFYLLTLATCYNNIALCSMKLKNRVEAIDWIQEVTKMYTLREELNRVEGYPWVYTYPTNLEFFTYFIKSQMRLAEVFIGLGNTGTAAYCGFLCSNFGLDKSVGSVELQNLRKQSKMVDTSSARHPSFKCSTEIIDPELQMRGSWKKLHAHRGIWPRGRSGFSSWIWRSTLYVYGGIDYCKRPKRLLDLWCLDLKSMNSWRRLPDTPQTFYRHLNYITETKMRVWNDEAWLFVGSRVVFKFNLLKEQWLRVATKWSSDEAWPYSDKLAIEYCAEIFEDQLHIFGGADSLKSTGVNLHMCLDLNALTWTKLGGTVNPQERVAGMPMFRKAAGSWVVPQQNRMYVLYGYASVGKITVPEDEKKRGEHQHEDMWSYSFIEKKWRPERLRGNFPAPRAKMACTYHPGLRQLLLFGGCNVRLMLFDGEQTRILYDQTHFGDTFVLDTRTQIWKQALTRNFPHHRADCHINVDTETGKIYLYGGSCSSSFMPLKKVDDQLKRVSIGDLWQLDLDLPGQNFDESEFDTKTLIRGFGPWKLCFGCKEYKAGIKKCGGTCAGKIYLCSEECQKQSWKEHKRIHQCGRF